eukprot:gene1163-2257_t
MTGIPRSLGAASAIAILVCVIVHGSFQFDQIYSVEPICNGPSIPNWIWYSKCFSTVAFLSNGGLLISHRILNSCLDGANFGATVASITVMLIAGISGFLELYLEWGGYCQDPFGVISSATQAGLVTGSVCIFLLYNESRESIYAIISTYRIDDDVNMKANHIRSRLRRLLLICLPSFPIFYFLGLSKIISTDMTQFLFILANVSTKLLFSSVAMENHVQVMRLALQVEERSNEARRAFMRFIMHDVRVPLNSITMGIDVLSGKKSNKDEFELEALEMMREASMFMGETLNCVLDMQKIEEGKLQLTFAPFSIVTMVKTVCLALKGTIAQKGLRLVQEIESSLPSYVMGDRSRIEHILANLLSNGLKFSPPGGRVTIRVMTIHPHSHSNPTSSSPTSLHLRSFRIPPSNLATATASSEEVWIKFSVTDEGPGISEENQRRLFQPFMQVDAGTLQGGGGSGVGLCICKQMVELHGGTIGVTSALEQGSTFSFILPLPSVSQQPIPIPIGESLSSSMEYSSSASPKDKNNDKNDDRVKDSDNDRDGDRDKRRHRVLLTDSLSLTLATSFSRISSSSQMKRFRPLSSQSSVGVNISKALITDDVLSNRRLLSYLLKQEGVECEEAVDGALAVEAVDRNLDSFDIIFMDNQMPNMNGMLATRAIRALGYDRFIIGLTGTAMDDEVAAFLEAGADMVFIKPMKGEYLKELLRFCRRYGNRSISTKKYKLLSGKFDRDSRDSRVRYLGLSYSVQQQKPSEKQRANAIAIRGDSEVLKHHPKTSSSTLVSPRCGTGTEIYQSSRLNLHPDSKVELRGTDMTSYETTPTLNIGIKCLAPSYGSNGSLNSNLKLHKFIYMDL